MMSLENDITIFSNFTIEEPIEFDSISSIMNNRNNQGKKFDKGKISPIFSKILVDFSL